jgi:DNA helicase-2/ATP-dependent DNA helicase PcrA
LYRSHFHALELQLELTRRNIPFSITSGIRFFEQAHIKDVIAYLKLVSNPRDELSFKRIVRLLPGIGAKSAAKLWECLAHALDNLPPATEAPCAPGPILAPALQACVASVPRKTVVAWAQLSATLAQLEADPIRGQAPALIRHVLDADYKEYLRETYTNSDSRVEDLEQLATFARQFKSPEEFLSELALLTNIDADDESPANRDTEQIKLSSIHQAKGLEFDVVFVIMLCEGLFPSARSLDRIEDEEEERRLFYVAVTRAKNELYLSYPLVRSNPGYTGDFMQQPSRFLHALPPDSLDEWNLRI